MKAIAGFFHSPDAADAALADLKLHGFPNSRLEPWPEDGFRVPSDTSSDSGDEAADEKRGGIPSPMPAGAQPVADLNVDDGGTPLGGWAQDSAGWVIFNAFQINEKKHNEFSEMGAAFVIVEGGAEKEAVVRSILERNGAEAVRLIG